MLQDGQNITGSTGNIFRQRMKPQNLEIHKGESIPAEYLQCDSVILSSAEAPTVEQQKLNKPSSPEVVEFEHTHIGPTALTFFEDIARESITSANGNAVHPEMHSSKYLAFLNTYVRENSYSINGKGERKPFTQKQVNTFVTALSQFEPAIVMMLQKKGLTFAIADPEKPPPEGYPGGAKKWSTYINGEGKKQNAGGFYSWDEKIAVFPVNDLSKYGVMGILHHEVGHAIDDLLVDDIRKGKDIILKGLTDDDKTLKKLYGSYKKREKNKGRIWSEYALYRNNIREYLAEGVSFYSSSISNRKTLKEKDHDLYEYIKKLLRKLQ